MLPTTTEGRGIHRGSGRGRTSYPSTNAMTRGTLNQGVIGNGALYQNQPNDSTRRLSDDNSIDVAIPSLCNRDYCPGRRDAYTPPANNVCGGAFTSTLSATTMCRNAFESGTRDVALPLGWTERPNDRGNTSRFQSPPTTTTMRGKTLNESSTGINVALHDYDGGMWGTSIPATTMCGQTIKESSAGIDVGLYQHRPDMWTEPPHAAINNTMRSSYTGGHNHGVGELPSSLSSTSYPETFYDGDAGTNVAYQHQPSNDSNASYPAWEDARKPTTHPTAVAQRGSVATTKSRVDAVMSTATCATQRERRPRSGTSDEATKPKKLTKENLEIHTAEMASRESGIRPRDRIIKWLEEVDAARCRRRNGV